MTVALVVFLVAAVIPVFFGKLGSAPWWLALQAAALGAAGFLRPDETGLHEWMALAEVLALRAMLAPRWLKQVVERRVQAQVDLMPSNLFAWAIAIALIVLAFEFGAPPLGEHEALALGTVAATVVVALLLLAANDAPPAQLVALLFMENAIALFELLLPAPWPLPVHVALSLVFVGTVGVGSRLICAEGASR
jgi:hydrogenase-4 membrane subunit HyfE